MLDSPIVRASKYWEHYLLHQDFVLSSDYQALQYLNSQKNLNKLHVRWLLFLQNFNIIIKYKFGKQNRVANAVEEFNTTISEFTKEPQLDACFQLYNKAQVWETKMSGEGGRRVQLLSVLQT